MGWARGCDRIAYYKSTLHYRGRGRQPFHTLTFRYTPEYDGDAVYFAHCYPYTTKQLHRDLHALEADPDRRRVVARAALCLTPAGLDCPVLTVTSPADPPRSAPKTGVFICARCAPRAPRPAFPSPRFSAPRRLTVPPSPRPSVAPSPKLSRSL